MKREKMDYKTLSREEFDAIVTGELTHYALWLEREMTEVIGSHFMGRSKKRADFEILFLRRDGLTFQDKIDIVRAMLPMFRNQSASSNLKRLLMQVEEFKAFRNAFAHGFDTANENDRSLSIKIEVIARSGKRKFIDVNPESHEELLNDAEKLLASLKDARRSINRANPSPSLKQ